MNTRWAFLGIVIAVFGLSADGYAGIADSIAASNDAGKLAAATPAPQLSNHSYAALNNTQLPPEAAAASPLPESGDDRATGFRARAYRLNDETVIAFAGTEIPDGFAANLVQHHPVLYLWLTVFDLGPDRPLELPPDLAADVVLAVGGRPAQFRQALDFSAKVKAAHPRRPIVFTGHSLGGALAVYSARQLEADAVTFNAPPLNGRLREDVSGHPPKRLFAFEAIHRMAGGVVRRDVVSAGMRVRAGSDPAVTVIDVDVPDPDLMLHTIDHFLSAANRHVRWVKQPGVAATLRANNREINVPAGSSVMLLGPPDRSGKVRALFLASRTGFASKLYVDRKGNEKYGTVTAPADVPLNVRPQPNVQKPALAKLARGEEVLILEAQEGEEVERAGQRSKTWYRVQLKALCEGTFAADALTADPKLALPPAIGPRA